MYTFEEIIGNEQMIKQIQIFLMLISYMEKQVLVKNY